MSEIKLTEKKARSLVHAILGSTGTFVITNIAIKAKFGSEGAEILGFIANKDRSFKQNENIEYFIKKMTPNAQDAIKRGFIYTTQYQIEDDLEIPIRTQTRLFKILKDDGVLLVEQHDVPKKNFFKINHDRLLKIIEQYDDEREERIKQRKLKRREDLEEKKKRQLAKSSGLVKPVRPEYKDTNNNSKINNNSFSKEKEIAKADGASDEAEKQADCKHNPPWNQHNDSWDSEINNIEGMNIEKQKPFGMEVFAERTEKDVKEMFVELGYMKEGESINNIWNYINREIEADCDTKTNESCNTNSHCSIEKEQEVEVNTKVKPKVKNGTTTLTHKLADEWEKLGFKKIKQDELKYIKNNTDAFLCGSVFELNNIEKVLIDENSFFKALDNRKEYVSSLIGREQKKQLSQSLSFWLWNPKSKSKNKSQFLIDLNGYEKKVVDKYPVLTEAIKKEYVKTILGSVSSKWTLYQEQDFIKSAKKMMEFIAVNRKNLRSNWTHPNEETMARWLIKSILASRNGVYEGIKTSFLRNDITFNSSLPSWLNNEAVLKG